MAGFLERAGGVLFRWRSFTPVPLLAVCVPLLWKSRGAAGPAWLVCGLVLCVAGQLLRAWVIGQVPDGTSGQNERLIATELNTQGPYAYTRNPLYLGNFGITLGLCLVAHDPWIVGLVALAFALQYRAIIAAEEQFLRGRFGAAYDAWCSAVPRFWPRLPASTASARRPWSLRRALRKEHNPLAGWLALALVLLGADALRLEGRASLPRSAVGLGVVGVLWLAVKGWKHRWLSGGFVEDLRRRARETTR